MQLAYLDNGATTRMDERVVEAMTPYFTESYGNASSLHSAGGKAAAGLMDARSSIAGFIGCDSKEVIFTSGGTESDNLAVIGAARALHGKGDHIITSGIEHPAVLNACKQLEREGFRISYLPVDNDGIVQGLAEAITSQTILVSIMHANNEIGTVQPINEISAICRSKAILFHTDAVQSLGKESIDLSAIDLLSASAHKLHGPKGVGLLYVRKGTKLAKLLHGGSHEHNLRPGTENVAGAVGFAAAVKLIDNEANERMRSLRDRLIKGLLAIPDTRLNGHPTKRLCNNVNISFRHIEGEGLLMLLNDRGIAVSTGSACSTKSLKPSHVLLAIGLTPEVAHGSIRFTLSRYTTLEEADRTIAATRECVCTLRSYSPLVT